MTPYLIAAGAVCLALILFAGLAQVRAWQQKRKDARDARELAALEKGADNPEVDESYAKTLKAAGEQ